MSATSIDRYVTDTHPLIWHLTKDRRLSPVARGVLERADAGNAIVHVSAMTLLEISLLGERGRVPPTLLADTFKFLGLPDPSYEIVSIDAGIVVGFQSILRRHLPELPDRVIAATALVLGVPLITCDQEITNSGVVPTVW